MYIAISLKNLLQVIYGTISNYTEVAQMYRLINLKKETSFDGLIGLLYIVFVYDFIIFVIIFYFLIYLILYTLIAKFGNKLWIQILYVIIIYFVTITYFDPFNYNFFFILISVIIGYCNWWLFEKWIKFA